MNTKQLELGFDQDTRRSFVSRRESRVARAAWWFARMYEIIQRAKNWSDESGARPEQTWLPHSHREVQV